MLVAAVAAAATLSAAGRVQFTDVTASSRLTFTHVSGASGRFYYIEEWGSGAAFLDYDGDGWLDIFLGQGGVLPGYTRSAPVGNRLFRNNHDGTFTDVTVDAGLVSGRYTLGAATADYDNDGHPDLFITTLQGNVLYHNDGHGHFVDVTAHAGVQGVAMSTSAAFVDYDGDGRLDLFVARYRDYDIKTDRGCEVPDFGMRPPNTPPRIAYCGPATPGVASRLYHNDGNGVFSDVTAKSGVGRALARGLGVAVADYNEDGRPDIFVASDGLPNLLLMNNGDGTFTDRALTAGVAVGEYGVAYAGMGVDAADYDNDGHIDLVVTNYENQPASLFRNRGDGTFDDVSRTSGVTPLVWPFMKWGVRLLDFDGDGLKDLFVANGQIYPDVSIASTLGAPLPDQVRKGYAQEPQLLLQQPKGSFVDASRQAGPGLAQKRVGRAAAFADIDNDGDWDVLLAGIDGPVALLRNDTAAGRWARLELEGDGCNRDAIGAIIRITTGDLTQTMLVQSGDSYLSDHDHRVLAALPGTAPATAEIRWPCGSTERVTITPNRTQHVREAACRLRKAGAGSR